MSFDAGSIMGRVGLNVSPFAQSMLEAGSIARSFPPVVQAFIANPLLAVVETLRGVGTSIGSAFKEATDFADNMGDLAQSVGVSVEALTSLGAVASQAGSSTEAVGDSFRFLGRAVADAMESADSSVAKTFQTIGVRFTEASGESRPLQDVMLDLSDAITRLPEGAARTSVAMELLGRSGTALVPTLAQGSAALRDQMRQFDAYGATVTAKSVASADAWNDSIGEMSLAWRGLKQSLVEPIRDALLPHLSEVLRWVRENMPAIRGHIVDVVTTITSAPRVVGEAMQSVRNAAIGAFESMSNAVLLGSQSAAGAISDAAAIIDSVTGGMLTTVTTMAKVVAGEALRLFETWRTVFSIGFPAALEDATFSIVAFAAGAKNSVAAIGLILDDLASRAVVKVATAVPSAFDKSRDAVIGFVAAAASAWAMTTFLANAVGNRLVVAMAPGLADAMNKAQVATFAAKAVMGDLISDVPTYSAIVIAFAGDVAGVLTVAWDRLGLSVLDVVGKLAQVVNTLQTIYNVARLLSAITIGGAVNSAVGPAAQAGRGAGAIAADAAPAATTPQSGRGLTINAPVEFDAERAAQRLRGVASEEADAALRRFGQSMAAQSYARRVGRGL